MSAPLAIARAVASAAGGTPRRWPGAGSAAPAAADARFLVNLSAGIGDALMALPLLRVLRELRPGARITLLATPANAELLGPEPGVDAVIRWPAAPGPGELLALAREVAAARCAVALCALPSDLVSTSVALKLAGVPLRIKHRLEGGERSRDWQFFFTDLVEPRAEAHKVAENLALLAPAGLAPPALDTASLAALMRLALTPAERAAALARNPRAAGAGPRIGLHPGCKPGWEFKRWDPERFAALADRLVAEHGAEILWFGGADEAPLVAGIMARMRAPSASVAGVLGIRAAAALMASCAVFVSNDSGPMHAATAAGVPVVALFNDANPRTRPARTGPFGPGHVVIGRADLQSIGPGEVAAAVAGVLGRRATA